ncbi:MAG: hypothetical protein HYR76_06035 [Ignavibacteria bacterium]|nr:hypothetical protein [Ignavibacteria bacterium]
MSTIAKLCCSLLLFSFVLLSPSISLAETTLPQTRIDVTIKGKQHDELKKYFGSLHEKPDILDEKIGQTLSNLMPKSYRNACRTMISKWGSGAKRTASSVMRVMYLRNVSENHQDILLVYTCYSSAKQYGDKFYDERLALLSIDSASSTLRTIPHGKPCTTCSELTRIGIVEDTLQIDAQPALSIAFATSHNNPCCTDSIAREEIVYHYYKLERSDLVEMAVIQHHRWEVNPTSPGDTTTYDSRISHETDPAGNIIKLISDYDVTLKGQSIEHRILFYRWNKKSHRFEETTN